MEQDILIYVDDKERLEASAAANSFAHKDIKNRAYINTLGAELAMKYLVSENIDISKVKNIHSIKKILEETDIADIMLENIHIDVRVVFDENVIFVPKSHFEYDILPDIYLVFNLSQDRSYVRFLGFFEPKLINKNNANSQYYFIEKEKLSSAQDLLNYINSFRGNTDKELSDDDFETSERFIVSMSDNDISQDDKKYLLKQLTKSAELRDRFIEYENFETLSYKAMNDPMIEKKELPETLTQDTADLSVLDEFNFDDNLTEEPVMEENTEEPQQEEIQEEMQEEIIPDEILNLAEEPLSVDENIMGETLPFEQGTEIPDEEPPETIYFEGLEIPESSDFIENTEVETISLDSVEIPETEDLIENTEVETISLDSVEIPETENLIENTEVETISLDSVEIPETEDLIENTEVEAISLDSVEIPETEDLIENTEVEAISLDSVEIPETEDLIENTEVEAISLDNVETSTVEETPVTEEPLPNLEEIAEPVVETIDEEPISEVIEQNNDQASFAEIPDIIEPFEDEPAIQDDDALLEEHENSSFGKNLLENLSAEEDDYVEIGDLSEHEEISAGDLLSQIDDVLNTSSTADIPITDEQMPTDNTDNEIEEDNDLNVLYSEETPAEDVLQNEEEDEEEQLPEIPGAALYNKKTGNRKSLITASVLIAILAISSAFILLKPKNEKSADIEPLPVNNQAPSAPQAPADDILTQNVPVAPKNIETPKPVVKELKNTPVKPVKSESYLEVNKLVWDVPDVLSYSTKMQNYLRTAGRSIKLSLSADLLLATEYAYTNQVKVGLKLDNNGSVQDARILSGSGSTQIDNIVLQSVKDTLNVVKPPSDEIKTPDFNLNLIIYF